MAHRMRFAPFIAALVALGAACSEPCRPASHVLLVVIDTLRADHLGCYGYERATSPHIDRLAREGALFRRATAQSSWTGPSMVSMFTGRHLAAEKLRLPKDAPVLAEIFREHGWRTAAFVVNPLVHNAENGFRRGFERFECDARFEDVRDWIVSAGRTPTFTYVHWVDPHDPYGPASEYEHFQKQPGRIPPELARYYDALQSSLDPEVFAADTAAIGRAINGYDDDVRLVDSKVDIALRALRTAGVLERSVVVVASDHGEGLWTRPDSPRPGDATAPRGILDTHKMTHGNQLYEELVHVPLVLFAPFAVQGAVIDAPVENVDILPTLLELACLPAPAGLTGRSLVPLLSGDADARGGNARDSVSLTRYAAALRTADGTKLILPSAAGRAAGLVTELYDLEQDPGERVNLAAERPADVERLRARLSAVLARGLQDEPGEWELSEENQAALRELGYVE